MTGEEAANGSMFTQGKHHLSYLDTLMSNTRLSPLTDPSHPKGEHLRPAHTHTNAHKV